jgi:hypothetical protein
MKSKTLMLLLKALLALVAGWIVFILYVFFCGLIGKFIMFITLLVSIFGFAILIVVKHSMKEFMKIYHD